MEVTAEQEINQVEIGKPHVVVLGAGASYAAFKGGDKHGRKLPLMDNLVEAIGLEDLISKSGIDFSTNNFELIYSEIHRREDLLSLREELEEKVYEYFKYMELPDEPTIYDHLVLSLREKDFIATFNWDPFLVQAIARNSQRFKLPRTLFLHGNVAVGVCSAHHMMGNAGSTCAKCGTKFENTKLLYPIDQKNYHLDTFISRQWKTLQHLFEHAFMVTIFGYGAPKSDATAVDLLSTAWGPASSRVLEEFEIIDIRKEDELVETWSRFIHSHHYRIKDNFYDSWIANHPRRTGEAYFNQFLEAKFIENNPIPKNLAFGELWDWYEKLQEVENEKANNKRLQSDAQART